MVAHVCTQMDDVRDAMYAMKAVQKPAGPHYSREFLAKYMNWFAEQKKQRGSDPRVPILVSVPWEPVARSSALASSRTQERRHEAGVRNDEDEEAGVPSRQMK